MNEPISARGRAAFLCVLLFVASANSACYTYRAQAPGMQPKTEPESQVVWSFAWGLVQGAPEIENCGEGALATVTTRSNYGFSLLTVVTLGLVSPMKIEWSCAGHDPEPAPFGATGESDSE